jgi:hypothetical protein
MEEEEGTYVVLPCLLLPKEKFNTRIIRLIATREFDSFRLNISISKNLNIEAMGVELWAAEARRQRRAVTMKSEQLSAEYVHAWFDVAGDFDNVGAVVVENFLICPFLLGFVEAVALDLEEFDFGCLGVWGG